MPNWYNHVPGAAWQKHIGAEVPMAPDPTDLVDRRLERAIAFRLPAGRRFVDPFPAAARLYVAGHKSAVRIKMRLIMAVGAEGDGDAIAFLAWHAAQMLFAANLQQLAFQHQFSRRDAAVIAPGLLKRFGQLRRRHPRLKATLGILHCHIP